MNAKPPPYPRPTPPLELERPSDLVREAGKVEMTTSQSSLKGLMHVTPEGFPGPTTALLIAARSDNAAAKHMFELMRSLKDAGLRVFVASPVNPPYGYELKKAADKFIPIPHREFSFSALRKLRRSIRKHRVSIVHSHGRTAGVYSRLLGFMTDASIIHTYHGIPDEPGLSGSIKQIIDQVLTRVDYDPVFLSPTERTKAISKGIVDEKREAFLIESSVDLTDYPKRKKSQAPFSKIDRDEPSTISNVRIGAFLRPESPKGHEHFLRLVREARDLGKYTCIGISRERLERYGEIPENLEVVGHVVDTTPWLYSLDTFVSTSTADGQIIGSLEAMAAGAICILSNVAAHEQFDKHHAVLLFDPKSVQNFAGTLTRVRDDRALRDQLASNSRHMIERFYDASIFKAKMLELYKNAARKAAKRLPQKR